MKNLVLAAFATLVIVSLAHCGGGGSNGNGPAAGGGGVATNSLTCQGKKAGDCTTALPGDENWSSRICYTFSNTTNGSGCTTGQQEFQSTSDYCAALQNDSLNCGCESGQRRDMYNQFCNNSSST